MSTTVTVTALTAAPLLPCSEEVRLCDSVAGLNVAKFTDSVACCTRAFVAGAATGRGLPAEGCGEGVMLPPLDAAGGGDSVGEAEPVGGGIVGPEEGSPSRATEHAPYPLVPLVEPKKVERHVAPASEGSCPTSAAGGAPPLPHGHQSSARARAAGLQPAERRQACTPRDPAHDNPLKRLFFSILNTEERKCYDDFFVYF